jgi:hypothetical protein
MAISSSHARLPKGHEIAAASNSDSRRACRSVRPSRPSIPRAPAHPRAGCPLLLWAPAHWNHCLMRRKLDEPLGKMQPNPVQTWKTVGVRSSFPSPNRNMFWQPLISLPAKNGQRRTVAILSAICHVIFYEACPICQLHYESG